MHRARGEAKRKKGLICVCYLGFVANDAHHCILLPILSHDSGKIRNLDRVQGGEVAQMTEGDKNTTGNISFGSSFLPHLHPLRLKCSGSIFTHMSDTWAGRLNTCSNSASALSPFSFSPPSLCSSHHSSHRISDF